MDKTNHTSICFAYFGDGKFLGWYSDTYGTITKDRPKVYVDTPEQRKVIEKNFRYKVTDGLMDVAEAVGKQNSFGGELMKRGLSKDNKIFADYKQVELFIVVCPHYDGPNPDYDRSKPFDKVSNNHWVYCDYAAVREWARDFLFNDTKATQFTKAIPFTTVGRK